ncbi:helix-turn-helix transcriptional regulator [Zongyangia hominis]|uniref:Helix-turn-helix transcriptional regulator n=1 Tax=Zongyangia hominis TaxID=2763677 RepID=A0A926ECY4_9FIRM|nr:helix-turn-helix transcriptional regulator [Zongyangia hominis]MBC8570773.1 helix-turn-helix transcriptional regulator [Zongyangia hominis]
MKRKFFDEYMKLGLNITYYRKMRGYTQEQLAEAIDITPEHMNRVENAYTGASLDTMFSIAKVLDIPVHKFFEFRD